MAVRIFRSLEEAAGTYGPCALSIGNFDGVHAGHRRILRRVAQVAGDEGLKPAALTFDPHPASVVAPSRAPRLLTTPEQRSDVMGAEGIQQVLILPFTREFSQLSPEEFVARVLVKALAVRAVLVGENFRFGRDQAGDAALLKQLGRQHGFLVEAVPAVRVRGRVVSSSEVRRLIEAGNVRMAARLLERLYAVEGVVVPGRGVGSRQTVPTLNLATAAEVLPANGVYVTRTHAIRDRRGWPSVTNVGFRPTFSGDSLSVETFLIEPLESQPPERIRVEFLYRLRDERKFPSAEALKTQILRDAARARAYFRRADKWARCTAATGLPAEPPPRPVSDQAL